MSKVNTPKNRKNTPKIKLLWSIVLGKVVRGASIELLMQAILRLIGRP